MWVDESTELSSIILDIISGMFCLACKLQAYVSIAEPSGTTLSLPTCQLRTIIDYCNSVMIGLPASSLSPLQRVQNAAARLIFGLNWQSHITPALQQLHWLPLKFRIIFKVATLMHKIFHHCAPLYLSDLITFCSNDPHCHQLQWSTVRSAMVCHPRTQFGRHALSVCGPDYLNNLPNNLTLIDSHAAF